MSVRPNRTVLLIDDSREHRAQLAELLRREQPDCALPEAGSGRRGLELLGEQTVDCVLLDYHVADMTAIQFLEALDEAGAGWGPGGLPVPVVVLTERESDDLASEVLGMGAQDYLVRETMTGGALVRSIENAIEKFQIYRQLEQQRQATQSRNAELEQVQEELQDRLAELAEAQAAKDRFMAVMSHEMRTPLNAILGYTDLLEMGLEGELNEGQQAHIERIRVGGRHLLDLINDVLDLARADARELDLELRPVNLAAVAEEVTALLQNQSESKTVELRVEPSEEPVHVHADLKRLRQVLTNLIGNAIKFTESGTITVRWATGDGDSVRIQVVDTGIGISSDVLPLIFDEFYQVDDKLTREKGGSGLGLAISRRLVRLMDGELEAESEPGMGSTFTITLREAEAPEAREVDEAVAVGSPEALKAGAAADGDGTGGGAQSLVVVAAFGSDSGALAELERQVQPNVRLVWTTSASELPELVEREDASLAVLDSSAEDGAAWRAAQAIYDRVELARTAVLLLPTIPPATSDEQPGGLDLGWLSLVPKPVSPDQLTRAVAHAARGGNGEPARFSALVVDDDPDSRRVAARILNEADVEVGEAQDGETALAEMRRDPPDVVVLDLMMPVLDGFGVIAAMRADPSLASMPVVVLTAKSLTEAERAFLARTAARVLHKGEHRLSDVAALVLRAAARSNRSPAAP